MLDVAQQRWPEIGDRKALLLRLAAVGSDVIGTETDERERRRLRELQLAALARSGDLVDLDPSESDAAWR